MRIPSHEDERFFDDERAGISPYCGGSLEAPRSLPSAHHHHSSRLPTHGAAPAPRGGGLFDTLTAGRAPPTRPAALAPPEPLPPQPHHLPCTDPSLTFHERRLALLGARLAPPPPPPAHRQVARRPADGAAAHGHSGPVLGMLMNRVLSGGPWQQQQHQLQAEEGGRNHNRFTVGNDYFSATGMVGSERQQQAGGVSRGYSSSSRAAAASETPVPVRRSLAEILSQTVVDTTPATTTATFAFADTTAPATATASATTTAPAGEAEAYREMYEREKARNSSLQRRMNVVVTQASACATLEASSSSNVPLIHRKSPSPPNYDPVLTVLRDTDRGAYTVNRVPAGSASAPALTAPAAAAVASQQHEAQSSSCPASSCPASSSPSCSTGSGASPQGVLRGASASPSLAAPSKKQPARSTHSESPSLSRPSLTGC
eukprot:Rhum_TRINITY_DN1345_c0_g1::Rhum_TRINITY_DN1345_c0_g1_i1::g.3887::m.3887